MTNFTPLCNYYQARLVRQDTQFVVAILKSFEHMAFDRTLDIKENIFEFFVSPDMDCVFIMAMNRLIAMNLVFDFKRLPNRLLDPSQTV